MKSFLTTTTCLLLAASARTASAHGNITSPPARQAGAAMAALCGQAAVDTVNADPTAPIENLPAEALASAECTFFLVFLPPHTTNICTDKTQATPSSAAAPPSKTNPPPPCSSSPPARSSP